MSQNPALAYRPDIDGLRAVAVLSVVFHHLSSTYFPGGFVGVDVFFVISGFLITKIISREIFEGRFSFSSFYERRIRRIFPALFSVIAVVLIAGYFLLLPSDYVPTIRAALGTVLFSSNIVFWHDLQDGYFAHDAKLNPLLHMWSLGVEEQFYLLFPLLLLILLKYVRWKPYLLLLLAAIISLVASIYLLQAHRVAVFFLLPFRAWELLVGSILALSVLPSISANWKRELISLIGIIAIVIPIFHYGILTPFPAFSAIPPVIGAALLIYSGESGITSVGRMLRLRPVVYIGLISYSLYLWHWPIIVFTRFLIGFDSIKIWVPILLAMSFIVSIISYHYIEKPFRTAGKSLSRKNIAGIAIVSITVVIVMSLVGLNENGFESRVSPTVAAIDRVRAAEVPYQYCESRITGDPKDLCIIGDLSKTPDILLWGDSHLLAWLPAFDAALKQSGRSAFAAPTSACPPILGLENGNYINCSTQNISVIKALNLNTQVSTVVLSGFWSKYFSESNIQLFTKNGTTDNAQVSPPAFTKTLINLHQLGKRVIVFGPVPVYKMDVPLALAQKELLGLDKSETITLRDVQFMNRNFYETINKSKLARFEFIDVATWICQPSCVKQINGMPIYRDSDHLSMFGSLAYTDKISLVLKSSKINSNLLGHNANKSECMKP